MAPAQQFVLPGFQERAAVVTGAGSGIGRAIAVALAEQGMNLVLADLRQDSLADTESEIRALNREVLSVPTDVADRGSVSRLAEETHRKFGAVAVLVNNAGVSPRPFRPIWEFSHEDWSWVMGVNFWGVVNGVSAFLPRMLESQGPRHIVTINSMSQFREMNGHAVYVTSKRAAEGYSECLARELEPLGIGVTIVYPGRVRSNLSDSESLRPEHERSSARQLSALQAPPESLANNPVLEPDVVAEMVIEAIAQRRRYLRTHPAPVDAMVGRLSQILGTRLSVGA